MRKCEKGGGGEHPPKSVISYLNSPLVCVKVDLPIIDLLWMITVEIGLTSILQTS